MALNLSNILASQQAPLLPEEQILGDIPQIEAPRQVIDKAAGDVITSREALDAPFTYQPTETGELVQTPVPAEQVQQYEQDVAAGFATPTIQQTEEGFNPYAPELDPRARLRSAAEEVGTLEQEGLGPAHGLAGLTARAEAARDPETVKVTRDVLDHWDDNVKETRDSLFKDKATFDPIVSKLNDAGLFKEERDLNRLPEALEISFNNTAEDIKKFRLEKQANLQEEVKQSDTQKRLARLKKKDLATRLKKRDVPVEESLGILDKNIADLSNQPLVRSVINNVVQGLDSQFDPTGAEGTAVPFSQEGRAKNTQKDTAALAVLRKWTEDGLLAWGMDEGKLIPITTTKGDLKSANSAVIQQTFNPVSRRLATDRTLTNVQPFATPKGNLQSAVQRAYAVKGGWTDSDGRGNNLSNATTTLLSSVFMKTSAKKLSIGQSFLKDIRDKMQVSAEGYEFSSSPYAEVAVNSPVSQAKVAAHYGKAYARALERHQRQSPPQVAEELARREAVDDANSYVRNAVEQADKHMGDAESFLTNPYTLGYDRSATNGRFTVFGSNAQLQAHKGTYRNYFEFANVPPTTGITPQAVEEAITEAKGIFKNQKNIKGRDLGVHTVDQLNALGENKERIVDTLFVVGTVLNNDRNELPADANYGDIIQYGYDNLDIAATRGNIIKTWNPDSGINLDNLPAEHQAWFNDTFLDAEKGEWGFPVSIYNAAAELKGAMDNLSGVANLNYTVEADSKQSNAILMSIVMGDPQITDLLSGLLDLQDTPQARDLRHQALSTITQKDAQGEIADIDMIFRRPADAPVREAMKGFFLAGQAAAGDKFAKMYGRGIACAGLYGKTPWKMRSETEEFLSKNAIAEPVRQLQQFYQDQFGAKWEDEMYEDLGQLMAQSMDRHMGSLQSYQSVVKSIQALRGAVGNSTMIDSMVPNEKILGASHDVLNLENQDQVDQLLSTVLKGATLQAGPQDVGGAQATPYVDYTTPDARAQISGEVEAQRLARAGAPAGTNVSFYGEKVQNMVPPVLIHSGDSYGIITATLAANSGRVDTTKPPVPMATIHDAILTGPGATLRSLVAYNNIFPSLMADRGSNYLANNLKGVQASAIDLMEKVLQDGQPVPIGDNSVAHKSVMGFFDKHFYNLDDEFIKDVIKEDVGSREAFLSPKQKARQTEQQLKQAKKSQKKSKLVLEKALELGWLPPTQRNVQARKNLTLPAEDFVDAVLLIMEASGLSEGNERFILPEKIDGEFVAVNWVESNLGLNETKRGSYAKKSKDRLLEALKESNKFGQNMTIDI